MKREEIQHLASLARIKLSEEELATMETDLSSILDYVSVVSEIAGGDADTEPTVSPRYNIFRKDEVTNEPNQYTEDILAEMPHTDGRFMKVKKILQIDE